MRRVTWYDVNSSDLRSIFAGQAVYTVTFAVGTLAMSQYWEISKDIGMSQLADQPVPQFMTDVENFAFWLGAVCWLVAVLAFAWQGSEWRRIRREHGAPTLPQQIRNWWTGNG